MKQFQLKFEDEKTFLDELKRVKAKCSANNHQKVSFFITWTTNFEDSLDKTIEGIQKIFPNTFYYGNECSGSVCDSELYYGISVLCTVLEDDSSTMEYLWVDVEAKDGPTSLKDVWEICKDKSDLKAIELIPSIAYIDMLAIDNTPVDLPENICVFGGASFNAINPLKPSAIIASGHEKTTTGMAVVLYSGKNLNVEAKQFHGWKGIGKHMIVTKSNGREIIEIDDAPAYSIYEKYLNLSSGKDELYNHFNFPLLVDEDGIEYIRIPQYVLPDKSMHMVVNVEKGSVVQMAYGDKSAILNEVSKSLVEISQFEPQVIKMYNCAGRKLFWGDEDANRETNMFKTLAPTSGSFTGTEIQRIQGKIKTLNATIVAASFREGEKTGVISYTPATVPEVSKTIVSKLAYFVGEMTSFQEMQYVHEKLRADVLDYMLHNEEDPIKLLEHFAERLRDIFNCDQVIYRDQTETRIIASSPAIASAESSSMGYCEHCRHFDARDPVYAEGFTEMPDNKKGYKGVTTHDKCPVKSSLTRIVYCDEKIVGLLAIHYICNSHEFTDIERKTLEQFTHILSIAISRYETKKENAELKLYEKIAEQKEELEKNAVIINTLVSDYTSVYFVNAKDHTFVSCTMKDDSHEFVHFSSNHLSYEAAAKEFVDKVVYEADKEFILNISDIKNLKEKLSKRKSYTITFRTPKNGRPYFCEMTFIKTDDERNELTSFAIGITEKDEEVIKHFAVDELENEYISIFYVDLNNNVYRTIREPNTTKVMNRADCNWQKAMYDFSLECETNHQKQVASIGNVEFLKKELSDTERREYIYRYPSKTQPWRRSVIKVVERKNGIPQAAIVSFISIDDERSKAMDLESQILKQSIFLNGLSHEFYIAWSIDDKTRIMHTLQTSMSDQKKIALYNKTDNQLYEDNALLYTNLFVFDDDRERFLKETQFDVIKKKVDKDNICFITYKHKNDNGSFSYHQACFAKAKDENNNISYLVAHRNTDAIIREQIKRDEQLKQKSTQLDNERFRADVMSYLADNEPEIDEFILHFADRLLEFSNCDQIIYKDITGVNIQKTAPGIDKISDEACKRCPHYDSLNNVYKNGGTEIPDTIGNPNGIPDNIHCPVKSAYTKVVRLNGNIYGHFAIQYIRQKHELTDHGRKTLEMFTQMISIALGNIDTKKTKRLLYEKNLQEIKKTRQIVDNYADNYDTVYIVNMKNDTFEVIRRHEEIHDIFGENSKFSESIQNYIQTSIFPEDREMMTRECNYEHIQKKLETTSTYSFEYRDNVSIKNKITWCEASISVLADKNEILVAMRNNNKAIVKRLVDEKIHTEFATILIVDIKNDLLEFISKSAESGFKEYTNGKYTEIINKYVNKIHDEHKAKWNELCDLKKVQNLLTKEKRIEYIYQLKGVKKHWRRCIMQVLDEENNVPTAFIMTYMTIDDKSAAEFELNIEIAKQKMLLEIQQIQLEEALSMAQSANKAKTTFLNNMSHDIRTPMNAIIGYTGLAASHIENKDLVKDYLSKINQSSSHLLSLINDVLDMSRIESGKMNLEEKDENLSEIIHTLRNIIQADIHSKQIDFFIDSIDIRSEFIICDKLRLNQVLLNILSNAIKYTPAKGSIAMRIVEKGINDSGRACFEFSIKDNGMGMDAEFLKTIYDPFTRVKSSTVSGIQGTGLGMAITKKIIDMMGGSITIESELNKGTEVTMNFEFKLQNRNKTITKISELQNIKSLVVDDDSNSCLSVSHMLREIGMRAEWCTSGKEAVIRTKESFKIGDMFKVYIIDWLMPDMNGIEVARRIRKTVGNDSPIIILTAYDWSDIETEAQDAGVTAFMSKPMFPSDLQKILNKYIGKNIEEEIHVKEYDFTGKKLLLVEDNELNREIANTILTENGFEIMNAKDGKEALDIVTKAKLGDFDAILMDLQMPIMDGYEATRHIRALGTDISKVPILAMTANAFDEDRKQAFEAGMNEHIAKPIDIDKLIKTLAKFL